jgi:hypothetical protein
MCSVWEVGGGSGKFRAMVVGVRFPLVVTHFLVRSAPVSSNYMYDLVWVSITSVERSDWDKGWS